MAKKTAQRGDKSPGKKTYAAAAVLTADVGGVVGLAKVVGIPDSYVSLVIFSLLLGLSLFVIREYWRS